ncbi:sensor histidine kinase [Algoriphagus antarcticus]|uniref:histidine kinase n=1 Tax=Algoriphagus antarcticus TaxID=238540 RepID=A0A3E0DG74_9BACT|nr:7TM diverse intracellular signaling domain-containing protein [Algoriphagus antarcticus]REG81685.1 phospho-acceptor domain-containing protein [Algoriphagus antarcticus]
MKGDAKLGSLYWGILLMVSFFLLSIILLQNNLFNEEYKVENISFYKKEKGEFQSVDFTSNTDGKSYSLGFVSDTVWAKIDLTNFEQNQVNSILEVGNPTFRIVELYKSGDGESINQIKRISIDHLGKSNPFTYPYPIFKVKINRGDAYYLKIFSTEPVNFSVGIDSEDAFYHKYTKIISLVSVYIGVMIALLLYNLFLYFSVKDKVYFFYCLYILFISAAQLSLLGYSYFLIFFQNSIWYENSIIIFSSLSGIFGVLFLRNFLQTKKHLSGINKGLTLIVIVYSFGAIFRVLGFVSLSYSFTDVGGLLVVVFFMSTGIIMARRGYRPAFYFLAAWGFFLFGLLLFVFQNQGVINFGSFSNLPMLVGTAFEAILLSLALADRINILKKEKEDEQNEKLRVLHDNRELIKQQNTMLEDKVKIRTDELEQALRNLQNTQSQLVNQEKMASLGQLTAGIAHEINNPINFVSSNIMPLKRDIKDIMEVIAFYRITGAKEFSPDSQKEAKQLEEDLELDYVLDEVNQLLKGMDDGARRTVEIVKGLRLFSRVDEQDMKKVDIHDGINSTIILLNSTMSTKIRIIRDFEELPLVECLAGKINQVFMNIINNAIHALADHIDCISDPKIEVRTRSLGEFITIEIIDNGWGMPEHVKQRIFEPFFTTKAVGKGTGLGLSIVYSIIESHKGTLEVITKESQGTTFKITLPIHQSTQRYE